MDGEPGAVRDGGGLSRRSFFGAAGAGAAAVFAGVGVGLTAPRAAAAAPRRLARGETADVVVVGSGMGGLTAAVRAGRLGATVIVLEKDDQPGGTMRESEGIVWTYGSYENMRNDAPDGDPELQRTLFDTLPLAFEFYQEVGVPLGGQAARNRVIAPAVFTSFMVSELERGGGRLLVETPMLRLLTNREHEVIGVLAEGPDGPVRVRARAVILATGGFPGNAQLVNEHITRHFGSLYQRNIGFGRSDPPLTGDGLWAAMQIGAAPSSGGFDAFYGHLLPARPARFTHPLANYSLYHGQWGVAVNLRGDRFTDESQGRVAGRALSRVAEELLAQETARQPEASAIYIWDGPVNQERALAGSGLGQLDKFDAYRDAGAPVATADTLEELAGLIEGWGRGVAGRRVVRTLEEYNEAARNGRTAELPVPKRSRTHALPIAEPPFFAVLGTTGITGTMGGLRVNPRGQVLSRTGRPIPGLFAAGIDVGNIGNYAYLGMLGYGAAFGYVSGANAARQPEPRGGWEAALLAPGH